MPGIIISKPSISPSEGDARYYQQGQFIDTSVGVADAGKPVKTDGVGVLADTLIPPSAVMESELIATTAGVADAGRPIKTDAGGLLDGTFLPSAVVLDSELIATTAGVADAGKPIKTTTTGLLDDTFVNSTTIAATDKLVKTLSSTGILDPTLTSQDATKEPTGFVNRTSSVLSFVDATRTFTIAGTNFIVYSCGVKITKNTESVVLPNTTGLYWIYYAPTTYTLTANTTPPGFDSGAILISNVYWNATKGESIPPGDERHGIGMDWNTHEMMHKTIRTRYEKGLTGTFTNMTMEVTSGTVWDEDIELTIPLTTQCLVLYRDGSEWEWATPNNTVHYSTGGNIQYDNAGVITPAGANAYVAYFVFATNNITYPIISIMGQRQDTTIANARANNTYESLSFGDLPFAEYKVLYRVIVRNDATPYEETQDLRSIQGLPGTNYVATAHGALTGLLNDDHTQYQLRSEFINSTAGVTDAAKPVETNASGLVDDTFLANSVLKSELINATAGATDAGKPIKTDAGGKLDNSFLAITPISDHGALTGLLDNDHPQYVLVNETNLNGGRLATESYYSPDQYSSSSTTIYYIPFTNDYISVYYGGVLITKNIGSLSIDTSTFPSLAASNANYDIFVYWTGSALALEAVKWSSDNDRATAVVSTGNFKHKSGDITRKYLGTMRTFYNTTHQVRDGQATRWLWNEYNRVTKLMGNSDSASYTYNSTTVRQAGGSNLSQISYVVGFNTGNMAVSHLVGYAIFGKVDTDSARIGIGDNTTTSSSGATRITIASTTDAWYTATWCPAVIGSVTGYRYYTIIEYCVGSATLTVSSTTSDTKKIWSYIEC